MSAAAGCQHEHHQSRVHEQPKNQRNPWEDGATVESQQPPNSTTLAPQGWFGDRLANPPILSGNANQEQSATLSGETTIPPFYTQSGPHASETVQANFPASLYHEGEAVNGIVNIPPIPGHQNFYNGLAGAHYENGQLKGIPVQMINGEMKSHADREISIPLHLNKK